MTVLSSVAIAAVVAYALWLVWNLFFTPSAKLLRRFARAERQRRLIEWQEAVEKEEARTREAVQRYETRELP